MQVLKRVNPPPPSTPSYFLILWKDPARKVFNLGTHKNDRIGLVFQLFIEYLGLKVKLIKKYKFKEEYSSFNHYIFLIRYVCIYATKIDVLVFCLFSYKSYNKNNEDNYFKNLFVFYYLYFIITIMTVIFLILLFNLSLQLLYILLLFIY